MIFYVSKLHSIITLYYFLFKLSLDNFLQEAKEKFQQLQKVMSILGDEEKRAIYDQTGCVDDAVSSLLNLLCKILFVVIYV